MIRVNLLPKELQRSSDLDQRGVLAVLALVLLVGLLSGFYAYRSAQVHNAETKLSTLQREVQRLNPVVAENSGITTILNRLGEEYDEVAALDTRKLPFWSLMVGISRVMDPSVWMDRVQVTADGVLTLRGSSIGLTPIANTIDSISNEPIFVRPELAFANLTTLDASRDMHAVTFDLSTELIREVSRLGRSAQ